MKRHLCLTDSEYSSFMHVCGLYLAQFLTLFGPTCMPSGLAGDCGASQSGHVDAVRGSRANDYVTYSM